MQLDIISRNPSFNGRNLRQYLVDNINTIGAFGDEPFSIRFRNSSPNKVQVKLSLDGTDIITGKVANLAPDSKMWVVNAYGTMELKAWPESHQGGAAFVFGSEANSVAAHTHGDLTAKGIISCAVFTEGYTPPVVAMASPDYYGGSRSLSYNRGGSGQSIETERSAGPAIGAGSYQDQKIGSAQGLTQPVFSQLIRVRYLWWDELVQKLQSSGMQYKSEHPTGFHGGGIDLGNTPRINDQVATDGYSRFV